MSIAQAIVENAARARQGLKAIRQSVVGTAASAFATNPAFTGAAAVGVAASLFGGISAAKSTDGSVSHKFDSGMESAIRYGMVGGGLAAGALTLSKFPSFTHPAGVLYGRASRATAGQIGNYSRSVSAELRTAGGWKNTITRAPIAFGAGAGIGALVGARLDRDHPGHGAMIGSAVGGIAGVGVVKAAKAAGRWGKLSGFGKFGILAAAAGAVGLAAHSASSPQYEVDSAATGNTGVRSRMDMIGASGDLVLGLHNKR